MLTMFKKIIIAVAIFFTITPSFCKETPVPKFIIENNLENTYKLGSQFIDHVSTWIYDTKSPDWFSGFIANVDVNTFEGWFPNEYIGENGYLKIIQEFNSYVNVVEKVTFEKSLKNKADVARAGVGLLLLLDRAKYRHINKTLELKTLSEYIYKKFLMNYIGGIGIYPDSAPFFMSFLITRYFDFPMDLVSQGMNSLGQLSIAYLKKNDKTKQRAIFQFMAGYAKYGLEKSNRTFQIFTSFDPLKWQIPLGLINTVLEFVKKDDIHNQDIRLFALQEKYKIVTKYKMQKEIDQVRLELLEIYLKNKITRWEFIKLKISEFISDDIFRVISLLFGFFLMLIGPLLSSYKEKGKYSLKFKIFLKNLWEAMLGRQSGFWGQIGLLIVVFCISMYVSDIQNYNPPINNFVISP